MPRGRHTSLTLELSLPEEVGLTMLLRSTRAPAGMVRRARMVLERAEGVSITEIARHVGVSRQHVIKWLVRFRHERLAGLADKPRPGRPAA